jgi:hypothetical protein
VQCPHLDAAESGSGRPLSHGVGAIDVRSIRLITLEDVIPELARRSGFKGTVDLLKVARHGPGRSIYLIDFHYQEES